MLACLGSGSQTNPASAQRCHHRCLAEKWPLINITGLCYDPISSGFCLLNPSPLKQGIKAVPVTFSSVSLLDTNRAVTQGGDRKEKDSHLFTLSVNIDYTYFVEGCLPSTRVMEMNSLMELWTRKLVSTLPQNFLQFPQPAASPSMHLASLQMLIPLLVIPCMLFGSFSWLSPPFLLSDSPPLMSPGHDVDNSSVNQTYY